MWGFGGSESAICDLWYRLLWYFGDSWGLGVVFKSERKAKLLISRLFVGVLLVKVGILCDFLVVGFLKLAMAI